MNPASRSFPEAIPVRGSCGYLTGILLHKTLNEPLCGVCVVAQDGWDPVGAGAAEAAARRAELEAELDAQERERRRGNKHRKGDYHLPVT